MAKIGVVGSGDKIMCFLASGFSVYDAGSVEEAKDAVKRAADDGCDVIFVTSEYNVIPWADGIYGDAITPAVIPLPDGDGTVGEKRLGSFVERAVGADILAGD